MKKLLALLLALVMILTMAACSDSKKDDEKDEKEEKTTQSEEKEPAEEQEESEESEEQEEPQEEAAPYVDELENYITAMVVAVEKSDLEKIAPAEVWAVMAEDMDAFYEKYVEQQEASLEELMEEYGEDVDVEYEILEETEVTEEELEEAKEYLETTYGIEADSVKEGYILKVQLTTFGSEKEDVEEVELPVLKIGSTWYVAAF